MPIKRQYMPPFADVMDAAQQVGAGQYNERRRAEALNVAELVQRDNAQRRAIAADQERQAAAFAQHQQDQQARFQLAGWQAALNQGNRQQERQWAVADQQFDRNAKVADKVAADNAAAENFDRKWEVGSIAAAEKGINAAFGDLVKDKHLLDEEGKKKLGELLGPWRAIQGSRATIPPGQYGQILNDFGQKIQRSGVYEHRRAPPTPEQLREQFASETVTITEGPFPGLYARDENGSWFQRGKPEKPVENKTPATFEERYKDFDKFKTDFDAESKLVADTANQKYAADLAAWEAADEAAADAAESKYRAELKTNPKAVKPERPPAPNRPLPPAAPTRDEVLKSLREKFEAFRAIQPAPAGQPVVAPAQPPQETILPVAENVATDLTDEEIAIHLDQQGVPPEVAAQVEREDIAIHEAQGDPDPVLAAAAAVMSLEPEVAQAEPVRLRPDRAQEDFASIPPGGQFIDPNGMLRRKPHKPIKTAPKAAGAPAAAQPKKGGPSASSKPSEVRKRSFERDLASGLLRKEVETYTDPETGETVTTEQILDRDAEGRIIGTTSYVRRQAADIAV